MVPDSASQATMDPAPIGVHGHTHRRSRRYPRHPARRSRMGWSARVPTHVEASAGHLDPRRHSILILKNSIAPLPAHATFRRRPREWTLAHSIVLHEEGLGGPARRPQRRYWFPSGRVAPTLCPPPIISIHFNAFQFMSIRDVLCSFHSFIRSFSPSFHLCFHFHLF